MATSEKNLYFFESDPTLDFKFSPASQRDCIQIPYKVFQLAWDDDKIFMCHAKGYYVINRFGPDMAPVARIDLETSGKFMPRVGDVLSKVNPLSKDDPVPMLSVFKDKCLVVSQPNKRAQFMTTLKQGRQLADDK